MEEKGAQGCVLTQNLNSAFIMLKNNLNSILWQLFRVGFGFAFGLVLLVGKEVYNFMVHDRKLKKVNLLMIQFLASDSSVWVFHIFKIFFYQN